jgi:hypothetical protein
MEYARFVVIDPDDGVKMVVFMNGSFRRPCYAV